MVEIGQIQTYKHTNTKGNLLFTELLDFPVVASSQTAICDLTVWKAGLALWDERMSESLKPKPIEIWPERESFKQGIVLLPLSSHLNRMIPTFWYVWYFLVVLFSTFLDLFGTFWHIFGRKRVQAGNCAPFSSPDLTGWSVEESAGQDQLLSICTSLETAQNHQNHQNIEGFYWTASLEAYVVWAVGWTWRIMVLFSL